MEPLWVLILEYRLYVWGGVYVYARMCMFPVWSTVFWHFTMVCLAVGLFLSTVLSLGNILNLETHLSAWGNFLEVYSWFLPLVLLCRYWITQLVLSFSFIFSFFFLFVILLYFLGDSSTFFSNSPSMFKCLLFQGLFFSLKVYHITLYIIKLYILY